MAAAVLAVIPFAESLGGGFVYDDHALIEQREAVHSLARLPELWRGEFWEGLAPIHFRYLRPLVSMSYALDWTIYRGHPTGFHATNLLLHAAVAALVYASLFRWSGALWGALVATLAWAWHPSKVEAVSWISGRTDLLCALGILLLCAGVKRRLSGARASGAAIEIVGLAVALASKEHAVVAPAFVAVEAWAHYGRGRIDRRELARATRIALPHTLAVVLYVVMRIVLFPIVPERAGTIPFLDARLYTLETIGEFAHVVFWPYPSSIQRAPIRVDADFVVLHDPVRLALGILLLAALGAALTVWASRREDGRVAGCFLALAALFPVANVVSAHMVFLFAERFAYVPLIGAAIALAPVARPRPVVAAAWGLVLIAFLALSGAHTRDFLTDRRLWQHELAVNSRDPMALRFACEDAMRRRDFKRALDLALRGYDAAQGWPTPRPDRVEFAARAARSLEVMTLDHDADVLIEIDTFYRTLLAGSTTARIDRSPVRISIDAGGVEAHNFRLDRVRLATLELWAAIAASRTGDCDFAVPLVRGRRPSSEDPTAGVASALLLARCAEHDPDLWNDALSRARAVAGNDPGLAELVTNLEWARSALAKSDGSLESALRRSRAYTLVLDRGKAYAALVPFERQILADREAAVYLARTAWAAGEDEAARRAVAAHLNGPEGAALLASWSRELGRD